SDLLRAGELTEVIVLTDKHQGELPQRADVQTLHEHALVGGTVPEETHGDTPRLIQLLAEGGPDRNGEPTADDAVGAKNALGEVGDVHGAAHAFADAGFLAPDLGHHGLRVAALAEKMAMTAMGARDPVGVLQLHADSGGHGLLPDVQVDGAGE